MVEQSKHTKQKCCIFRADPAVISVISVQGPAVMCSACQKEGHVKRNCPDNRLPPLPHIPRPSKQHIRMLDEFLNLVPGQCVTS